MRRNLDLFAGTAVIVSATVILALSVPVRREPKAPVTPPVLARNIVETIPDIVPQPAPAQPALTDESLQPVQAAPSVGPEPPTAEPAAPAAEDTAVVPEEAAQETAAEERDEEPRFVGVVFDISTYTDISKVNEGLVGLATAVNAAGRVGGPARFAAVLHGDATAAALTDAAYSSLTWVRANPNTVLIAGLRSAGVALYVSGASMAERNLGIDRINPAFLVVENAAPTILEFQVGGYAYVKH